MFITNQHKKAKNLKIIYEIVMQYIHNTVPIIQIDCEDHLVVHILAN